MFFKTYTNRRDAEILGKCFSLEKAFVFLDNVIITEEAKKY